MARNQIKICSDITRNHIDYYWYGDDGEWGNMADRDDSPLNVDYFISAPISCIVHDIYRVLTESYYHPVEGLKIIFVGSDDEFEVMLMAKRDEFPEYDIEIEHGVIEGNVCGDKPNNVTEDSMFLADEQKDLNELQENLEDTQEELSNFQEQYVEYEKIVEVQEEAHTEMQELCDNKQEVMDDFEEFQDMFETEDLQRLHVILEQYDVKNNVSDYKKLAEQYPFIVPKAYLGKDSGHLIYFTTAGLYVNTTANGWVSMLYSELCMEQMLIDTSGKSGAKLFVSDKSGNCIQYEGSKEACNSFMLLLKELNAVKTIMSDEYAPIWIDEYWSGDETYLYGEILVDFLKLGKHDTMAALMKCGQFIDDNSDDEWFRQICEYGISSEQISLEDLKEKVVAWKNALEPQMQDIYMAIMFKDLVEILQIATEEKSMMTVTEKLFFDWLAKEACITDVEQFKEMVMLPYCLAAWEYEETYSQKLAEIEKIAHKGQLDIPYEILDNEKMGFWSSLHAVTKKYWSYLIPSKKKQAELDDLFVDSKFILYCEFMMVVSSFIYKVSSLDNEMLTERTTAFLSSNVFLSEIIKLMSGIWDNEEWVNICEKYYIEDRRHVGAEVVEWWLECSTKE